MFVKCWEKETETYNVGDGFYIDIDKTIQISEVWIYHKDYGIKELAFGVVENDYLKLLKMIENDLPESKKYYEENYMNIESEKINE